MRSVRAECREFTATIVSERERALRVAAPPHLIGETFVSRDVAAFVAEHVGTRARAVGRYRSALDWGDIRSRCVTEFAAEQMRTHRGARHRRPSGETRNAALLNPAASGDPRAGWRTGDSYRRPSRAADQCSLLRSLRRATFMLRHAPGFSSPARVTPRAARCVPHPTSPLERHLASHAHLWRGPRARRLGAACLASHTAMRTGKPRTFSARMGRRSSRHRRRRSIRAHRSGASKRGCVAPATPCSTRASPTRPRAESGSPAGPPSGRARRGTTGSTACPLRVGTAAARRPRTKRACLRS